MIGELIDCDASRRRLIQRLLDRRAAPDHWEGHLSSSALSTATAILALHLVGVAARTATRSGRLQAADNIPRIDSRLDECVASGAGWLIAHQNSDGGWGDTVRSKSNISTTAIAWASLAAVSASTAISAIARAHEWLTRAAGGPSTDDLRAAILERYGKDRTFSVPILTLLALAGRLGQDSGAAWRSIPQLPFELASLPHSWFQYLSLPVVSYALPALIAIGQVRHHHAPTRNVLARFLRNRSRRRTLRVLREMQPASGGYLEATPLTSFVVMSLAGMGDATGPVVEAGAGFLIESMRTDGSWPIDTNLATWVTTLSINALSTAEGLTATDKRVMKDWLLAQQSAREHPFTHAAPGAWAWTPLSGGVPDADDTSGALVALRHLGGHDSRTRDAAARGARWLVNLQNRDGGIPTFCRGWGTLPFDQSTPEITAHALLAWSAWHEHIDGDLQTAMRRAADRAVSFMAASQRSDGSWVPRWFGNERADGQLNPVYGTARAVAGLQSALVREDPRAIDCCRRGAQWLLTNQNDDGGWGGSRGVPSSIEETGVVLAALGPLTEDIAPGLSAAVRAGGAWLMRATAGEAEAAPVGLYFAQLWYYEDLYPLVFALAGLTSASRHLALAAETP
jgi:squalene-hopene/tetraprenyl-beta-curcumene cyclase